MVDLTALQFRNAREQDRKITWVRNVGDYGFEGKQPLIDQNVPDQLSVALSAAQYQRNLHPYELVIGTVTNFNPLLPYEVYYDDTEQAAVSNFGDNTAYNANFMFHSHATGYLVHFAIVAGFCLNVAALTSGTINFAEAVFTLQSWKAPGQRLDRIQWTSAPTTPFTTISAGPGAQIFNCFEHLPPNKILETVESQPITLNITLSETNASFVGTRQIGLMPALPLWGSPAGVSKPWTHPGIITNIKPGLNSADMVGQF